MEVILVAIVVVGGCWLVTGGQRWMDYQAILSPVEPVLEVVVLVECPTLDNVKVARAKDFIVLHVIPGSCNVEENGLFTFPWPELVDSLAFFCCAPLERAGRLVHRSSEGRDHLLVRRGKSPSQTPLPPRILKYGSTPPPLSLTLVLPLSQAPL